LKLIASTYDTQMASLDHSLSPVGAIISDTKFRIDINFIDARVVYVPRARNKPAHELAAWGFQESHTNHVILFCFCNPSGDQRFSCVLMEYKCSI
jgi:hypothetical protein